MTAIQSDAAQVNELAGGLTEDDAAEELLRRFLPPEEKKGEDASKEPSSEKTDEEKPETAKPEDKAEDKEDAEKPSSEDKDEDKGTEETEETEEFYVKVKVDGKEEEVPVSKLTRLWGQEAALTKKSMEVAELRKAAETDLQKQTAASGALLERARARFEPFSKLDFHLLATQLPAEEYTALRQSAQAAWEDVQFLEKHVDDFMTAVKKQQANELREQAQESLKVLSGPVEKGGIEGWSQQVYDDIRAYAIAEGAPAEEVNKIIAPWAIKLAYNAMLFQRGKGKDKGTVVVKKVNKTPTKITKTTTSPEASKAEDGTRLTQDAKKKMARLRATGDMDDAAEALLARWRKPGDE